MASELQLQLHAIERWFVVDEGSGVVMKDENTLRLFSWCNLVICSGGICKYDGASREMRRCLLVLRHAEEGPSCCPYETGLV